MYNHRSLRLFLILTATFICGGIHVSARLTQKSFGKTSAGEAVTVYTLSNPSGMTVEIMDYGATAVSINVPDKHGVFTDIVIGYNNMEDYQERSHNFGSTVGRYAGVIQQATFDLDGVTYELAKNNGQGNLHAGPIGFDRVVWTIEKVVGGNEPSLLFKYISPDGDQGFPGELTVFASYKLTEENELEIEYTATTTKATPVNLTHHSYFNLKGDGVGDVRDHLLQINASTTPTATNGVPSGEIESLVDTPLDFLSPHLIGERIDHPDLVSRRGYNHYYILDNQTGDLIHGATLSEPVSGRTIEVWTTELGIQLYTGNWLSENLVGKTGVPYVQYGGVCLEAEHYTNSPNRPEFPSTILRPGETYSERTVYKFGVEE